LFGHTPSSKNKLMIFLKIFCQNINCHVQPLIEKLVSQRV
jgi:hypothetical protein